ncbi:SurA N-terminal domain-containing protein [Granulicella tundricola]|uniref:SurA domain protein n=1 Tax=Granulicella tundricola (strain ATCC BAA-1859 / DSM 23138 / MP5ACTX9) TaxID=1198114 RepID=E8X5P9_GRATM|nr:SurA N-terminal domain-containing protein [Granulicella tundricola]ADW70676.1 SurA domain protein [Granulicella tundricola MP5ACTX9]
MKILDNKASEAYEVPQNRIQMQVQAQIHSQTRQRGTLFLLIPLLALAGCHPQHSADVMATVNGHAIMRADLDKVYNLQLGEAQQSQPSAEQADSQRLGLLKQLIDEEIVQQRATKMNLTATNEEVDAKLAEMKAPYTEEQFDGLLRERHTSVDDIKRDLRRSLTMNKLLNKEINSKVTVSDADITSYFNQHKSEFNNIETQYHIARILVTSSPAPQAGNLQGSKAQTDADAKKKILALKNRVDSGEDFGSLAMNFSEDPQTSASGGDMGSVAETQMKSNPIIFNSLANLKPGQVTDIMPFPDPSDPKKVGGYAIFQLLSRDPAGQHDVSEPQVQQRIRQGLHDARSQLLKGAYYEMLRDHAKVENFYAEQIFKSDAH